MNASIPAFSSQVTDVSYACIDMAPRAHAGVVVSCVGRERCLPDYRTGRDGYACHGMEFVFEGAGTLQLAGREYRLQPGHVFTYGPGIPHAIESDPRRPLVKYFVDFFGREASALCRDAGVAPPGCVIVGEPEVFRHVFEELLREAQKSPDLRGEISAAYLRVLLLKTRERRVGAGAGSSRAFDTLQRALHVIDRRHTALSSLAAFGCSSRAFQVRHGASLAWTRKN